MKFMFVALFLAFVAILEVSATDRPYCICTRDYSPVCGNNGVTYANKCEFQCAKDRLQGRAADDFKITRGGECDGPEVPEFIQELK